MLLIESALIILTLALAFIFPSAGSKFLGPIERGLARLARQRRRSVLVVGICPLAMRAVVLPILPVPYPALQDEFSYQLMADTFSHGRVTNPTHPMWVHFESVTVIHQPTYCSVFYPAQGLFMAVGELLAKHTFWGVWLSTGVMCAAICWMLQGWISPLWALIGGLLAAIRIGTFSYWANSYWGGAVAAIGGALVLGALPRIKRRLRIRDAILMGVGFGLLANSRPFEGLFFSLPIVAILIIWVIRHHKSSLGEKLSRTVIPLTLVLAATGGFMMLYFWRTTGDPFVPPYVVNLKTYFVDPVFPWLPLHTTPQYHQDVIRRHYLGFNIQQYEFARNHPFLSTSVKILMLWFFFLGPLLSLPFLALGFVLPSKMSVKDIGPKIGFLLLVCAATLLAVCLPVYTNPHYAAPFTAAVYALIMLAMQRVRRWNLRSSRNGVGVVRAVLFFAVVLLALRIAIPLLHLNVANPAAPQTWASPWFQLLPRAAVESRLEAIPGDHLVIVHYGPTHDERQGWISNAADIDHSRIVWAHDMGPKDNEELVHYFAGRHIWTVYPDLDPVALVPYDTTSSNTR